METEQEIKKRINFESYLIKKLNKLRYLEKKPKETNRKLLTREEMWYAIRSKYISLDVFSINAPHGIWSRYVNRRKLLTIIMDMKLHKSRHLKKKQKLKIAYELEQIKLNKTIEQI